MDDRFAPHAAAVVLVGADAKLVGSVGFQVVDDRVTSWAGLIDPLPVPLSVADGVKPRQMGEGKVRVIIKSQSNCDKVLNSETVDGPQIPQRQQKA